VLVGAQLVAGVVNVSLLAPVWMQLVHLLLADAVWIAFLLCAANAMPASAIAHARLGTNVLPRGA
jgi:hypothetical protein